MREKTCLLGSQMSKFQNHNKKSFSKERKELFTKKIKREFLNSWRNMIEIVNIFLTEKKSLFKCYKSSSKAFKIKASRKKQLKSLKLLRMLMQKSARLQKKLIKLKINLQLNMLGLHLRLLRLKILLLNYIKLPLLRDVVLLFAVAVIAVYPKKSYSKRR